jgi:hypothetical protein
MTLPLNIILPEPEDFSKDSQGYVDVLVRRLEEMYESISRSFNGSIRSELSAGSNNWTPTLSASTAGTFTYTTQVGSTFRQGTIVDVWGFVQWSATTASGTLQIDLPYKVALTNSLLTFVGTCTPSGIPFATGTACNIAAVQNTYYASIQTYGTAIASAILNVPASGSLTYHLRYLGATNG